MMMYLWVAWAHGRLLSGSVFFFSFFFVFCAFQVRFQFIQKKGNNNPYFIKLSDWAGERADDDGGEGEAERAALRNVMGIGAVLTKGIEIHSHA